jgi:hypothetical protein
MFVNYKGRVRRGYNYLVYQIEPTSKLQNVTSLSHITEGGMFLLNCRPVDLNGNYANFNR